MSLGIKETAIPLLKCNLQPCSIIILHPRKQPISVNGLTTIDQETYCINKVHRQTPLEAQVRSSWEEWSWRANQWAKGCPSERKLFIIPEGNWHVHYVTELYLLLVYLSTGINGIIIRNIGYHCTAAAEAETHIKLWSELNWQYPVQGHKLLWLYPWPVVPPCMGLASGDTD